MDVGFIGLGNIGGPCARHLVEAGYRVTVFDIDEDAVDRMVRLGALAAASAADVAAGTEAVFCRCRVPRPPRPLWPVRAACWPRAAPA